MALVRETSAGSSISVYVILNKKGEHVAEIHQHYGNSRVTANVFNHSGATERCLAAALKDGVVTPSKLFNTERIVVDKQGWKESDARRWAAHELFHIQVGSASGGGYDKGRASLAGLYIDGHRLTDDCGSNDQSLRMMRAYVKASVKRREAGEPVGHAIPWQKEWDAKAEKIGARFANWSSEHNAFISLHLRHGLERLSALGYRVIQGL